MPPDVLELFVDLAAMKSPPGEERQVADRVALYLRELGLVVEEDGAGAVVDATAGNLYCRVEPTDGDRGGGGGVPIFLCAHLDTVPPAGEIEPVVEDGTVRNAAGTILGADNKSAAAAMLDATRRVVEERRPHAGLELLFTPKEEVGLLGAAAFDESRLAAKVGYVYDQAAPIGEVILGAPYSQSMEVRFHGRASHSGMYPEEGRSAIAAAARAIADLRLGRVDEESTANVGLIEGGTAANIVPDSSAAASASSSRRCSTRSHSPPAWRSARSRRTSRRAIAATASGATTWRSGSRRRPCGAARTSRRTR